jgi:hypothetical protein
MLMPSADLRHVPIRDDLAVRIDVDARGGRDLALLRRASEVHRELLRGRLGLRAPVLDTYPVAGARQSAHGAWTIA